MYGVALSPGGAVVLASAVVQASPKALLVAGCCACAPPFKSTLIIRHCATRAGVGLGVTGAIGVEPTFSFWDPPRFVFGVGAGCGVGIGYGVGFGLGKRWDQAIGLGDDE